MAYNPKTGKGLGRYYDAEHRAFRAREWRGFKDTFYDFFRWLYLYGFMAVKLGCHPILMVKSMLRYRWMVSYLTAGHMVDRHTMGLRGKELHYAHNQFFSVLHNSVIGVRDIIVRDKNLRPNSKRAAKLRENTVMFDEMTPHLIMMGFPTVKWIDIAMFAIGLPSEVDQNASMFYIDAMEHLGLPADVCPEPASECGCAVVDDYPRVGKCYFTGTMPCDGAISQTNILTRHFKELPSFQITPPQRVNEPEVQTYAVKNLKKGIEFLEQQFGVPFNWDTFIEHIEDTNEFNRGSLNRWDIYAKSDNGALNSVVQGLFRIYFYQQGGTKYFKKANKKINRVFEKCVRKNIHPFPLARHRALAWSCGSTYYAHGVQWLYNCWGIMTVINMDSLTGHNIVDTTDRETMMSDIADWHARTPMRTHTVGGNRHLMQMWETAEKFNCDTIIMYDDIGCKGMAGAQGLLEEEFHKHRDRFNIIWMPHSLMDCRIVPTNEARKTVNQYMQSVMHEEPIDPTLVDFDDEMGW